MAMGFKASWMHVRARWRWVRGRCPRCNHNLSARFASYMTAYPNCPVCKDKTATDGHVWDAYRVSTATQSNGVPGPARPALVGMLLVASLSLLQAQEV